MNEISFCVGGSTEGCGNTIQRTGDRPGYVVKLHPNSLLSRNLKNCLSKRSLDEE